MKILTKRSSCKKKLDSPKWPPIKNLHFCACYIPYRRSKFLTPTLVNSLIERIEVHNSDKSDGHSHVKVDIYFTAVGMIDIPTEKEILATMEEIRNNPQDFKFVA